MQRFDSIVCCFAHPDDESFACGGTIACFVKEGAHVTLVCATDGGRGGKGFKKKVSESVMVHMRKKELQRASHVLGMSRVVMFGYKDKELKKVSASVLENKLIVVFKKSQPDLVITFGAGGFSGHPDHKAIARRTASAFRKWKGHASSMLWQAVTHPKDSGRHGYKDIGSKRANIFVSIKPFAKKKLRAIHAHQTQVFSRLRVGAKGDKAGKTFFTEEAFVQNFPSRTIHKHI